MARFEAFLQRQQHKAWNQQVQAKIAWEKELEQDRMLKDAARRMAERQRQAQRQPQHPEHAQRQQHQHPHQPPPRASAPVQAHEHWKSENPWACLKLPTQASRADARRQFHKLCLEYHPDKSRHPHATEAFIAVRRAYSVIEEAHARRSAV